MLRPKHLHTLMVAVLLILSTTAGHARPLSDEPPPGPPLAPGLLPGRPPASKPASTRIRPGQSSQDIVIKFAEGSGVRLRPNGLISIPGRSLAGVAGVLRGRKIERWFPRPEDVLDDERGNAQQRAGFALADLNLYYSVRVSSAGEAEALIDALNQESVVELAYPAFLPAPLPESPDLRSQQDYLDAPPGLNASYAWTKPGGTGTGIRIIDLEYYWNFDHEDLAKAAARPTCIYGSFYTGFGHDHGTAVLGELIATKNAFGVTGQAYGASVAVTCATDSSGFLKIAQSINAAAAAPHAKPGDVILLEQQIVGPNYQGNGQQGLVPVEWDQATFDAIQTAVASGVNIVETGGNGSENLDAPEYEQKFSRSNRDSGAILVGAGGMGFTGGPADRVAFDYSNYGSRFDVQAWGGSIYTAGYGDHYSLEGVNAYYTRDFGGTSGAGPMIAAAVANLNGIYRAAHATAVLKPQAMRTLLRVTGTPQPSSATRKIGPRPNLVRAVDTLLNGPPSISVVNQEVTEGNSGTRNIAFKIQLSAVTYETVTVQYATVNWTALAGTDYTARSGKLTFAPGKTSQQVNITILADTLDEVNETFLFKLSSPTKATLAVTQAVGKILDDDPTPTITINNARVTEPDSGQVNANFVVRLSAASGRTVTVKFATADESALAGTDYTSANGTITFPPGTTARSISIRVLGDTAPENEETFAVNLSTPVAATIADARGQGRITNDD